MYGRETASCRPSVNCHFPVSLSHPLEIIIIYTHQLNIYAEKLIFSIIKQSSKEEKLIFLCTKEGRPDLLQI